MIPYVVAFGASVLFVLVVLPLFALLAKKVGLVDHPDKKRKLHESAIPLVGGIVVGLGATIAVILTFQIFEIEGLENNIYELVGLLVGSATILLVGVLDDRFGLRGRQKLAGQILAATVLILFGYRFHEVAFASMTIKFGIFSVGIVYLWILIAINSVNLLDGADGFATTIGIVMFSALAIMAIYNGSTIDAIVCLAFAGALLGFLRFNFPPAKAFLGDAGSMLIGFVLAAITIRCTFKQATAYAFFAPIALLAIPLIDTAAAILRRRLTGRSIYATDRGHLHHAMAKKGLGPRASLIWVGLLTASTATGGILSLITKQSEFAVISIGVVLVVLLFGKIFGVAEFELVSGRALGIFRSMFKAHSNPVKQSSVQLQGNRDWQVVWEQLCQFAEENGLNEIMLDVNAPWIHESFHAKRRISSQSRSINDEWQTEVPLISETRLFGRIVVWAPVVSQFTHHEVMTNVIKIAADVEVVMEDIILEESKASHAVDESESENVQSEKVKETSA